jgi:uncharacterized membrane protein YkoI
MRRRSLLLALAALCVSAPAAFADPGDHRHWRDRANANDGQPDDRDRHPRPERGPERGSERGPEHGPGGGQRWSPDDARQGVREGRLRPLSSIVGELQGRYGGRLLGQELANEGPRTVYHIRWVTSDGRLLNLVVDAQSR